jgi:hypothetical protein
MRCDVRGDIVDLISYDYIHVLSHSLLGPELLAYLKHIVHTHKLLEPPPGQTKPLVRLNTEVEEARWDGAAQRWAVTTVNNGACRIIGEGKKACMEVKKGHEAPPPAGCMCRDTI